MTIDGYVRYKARSAALNAVRNIRALASEHYAVPPRMPARRAGLAIVCGAGPSLTASLPWVKSAQAAGALVVAVNTAAPAVSRVLRPDIILCREVVDSSRHVAESAVPRLAYVLDAQTNAPTWAAAAARAEVAWMIAGAMQYFEIAASLDVRPLLGGPSALTAGVSLAYEWGAATIAIVGADLCFAEDGAGYAEGSGYAGFRMASQRAGLAVIEGDGADRMDEGSVAASVRPPPREQTIVRVPLMGGGEAPSITTWAAQIDWLAQFADERRIPCINATARGAAVPGWLTEVPRVKSRTMRMERPRWAHVTPEARAQVMDELVAQARRCGDLCATMADPDGSLAAMPGFYLPLDVVEAVAAGRLVELKETVPDLRRGLERTYQVLAEAAIEVAEAAAGG